MASLIHIYFFVDFYWYLLIIIDPTLKYRFDSFKIILNPSTVTPENIKLVRNMSVLSWLNSADKALYVFNLSPIIGLGPGSTGYFPFISRFYKELLIATNGSEINRFDGYSLLFRGTIEYGFLFLTIILLNFRRYFYRFNNCIVEEKGLLLMALTLFIGSLIKQTTLCSSLVFLGFYIPLIRIRN